MPEIPGCMQAEQVSWDVLGSVRTRRMESWKWPQVLPHLHKPPWNILFLLSPPVAEIWVHHETGMRLARGWQLRHGLRHLGPSQETLGLIPCQLISCPCSTLALAPSPFPDLP